MEPLGFKGFSHSSVDFSEGSMHYTLLLSSSCLKYVACLYIRASLVYTTYLLVFSFKNIIFDAV
jgi:hypothetical protein